MLIKINKFLILFYLEGLLLTFPYSTTCSSKSSPSSFIANHRKIRHQIRQSNERKIWYGEVIAGKSEQNTITPQTSPDFAVFSLQKFKRFTTFNELFVKQVCFDWSPSENIFCFVLEVLVTLLRKTRGKLRIRIPCRIKKIVNSHRKN